MSMAYNVVYTLGGETRYTQFLTTGSRGLIGAIQWFMNDHEDAVILTIDKV
jgi:hypothetical protein